MELHTATFIFVRNKFTPMVLTTKAEFLITKTSMSKVTIYAN